MAGRIKRVAILTTLAGILFLGLVLLSIAYIDVGITDDFWSEGLALTNYDLSDIPQDVAEDAVVLAHRLFGDNRERYQQFVDDLLATYAEAKGEDFVVVFNSGGWGWNLPEKSPGWESILSGIRGELRGMGYSSLVLNYRRTGESMWGRVEEFTEVLGRYPSKARELAYRVDFLTEHIPDLKVIVTGESNGTVIADRAMYILQDNQQVYSIQTGPPFWHKPFGCERSLIMKSNGTGPDAFNQGDIPGILWASLKSSLGIKRPDDRAGTIFVHLKAPGHDYSWQYPEVCRQIVGFIDGNFSIKQR